MQFVSELFSHGSRIDAVANQLRPDENDDLRAGLGAVGVAEQIPQELDLAQSGYSGLRFLLAFADKAPEQNRLTASLVTATVEWTRLCEIVGVNVC